MLLNTNSYSKTLTEGEPHNVFTDFSATSLFDGPDRSFQMVKVGFPSPITEPLSLSPEIKDPINQALIEKREYESKLKRARSKKLLEDVKKVHSKQSEYRYIPKQLLELYHLEQGDADLTFDYNVFYTNGILDTILLGTTKYLVWRNLDDSLQFWNPTNDKDSFNISLWTDSPIFSVKGYNIGSKAFVLLRMKFSIILIEVFESNNFSTILQHTFDKAILDAKINYALKEHFGAINVDNEFVVRKSKSKNVICSYKSENKLLQFDFLKEYTAILMDTFMVKLYDYKDHNVLKTFDPQLMACNQLCNFKVFGDKLILISRHYVMKTDIATFKEFAHFGHTLGYASIFMDVLDSNDTFLCVANHSEDEKVLFAGNVLYGLPQKVPGIKSTLNEAIARDSKLVLKLNLKERVSFSTAGVKFVENNDQIVLYFVNSLGELWSQEVSFENINNDQAIEKFTTWANKLKNPEPQLCVTGFAEMGDCFLFLNKPLKEDKSLKKSHAEKSQENIERFLNNYKPTYSKANIQSTFGKALCEIWESDSDSDQDTDKLVDDPEVPYYDKVSDWMDKQVEDVSNSFADTSLET